MDLLRVQLQLQRKSSSVLSKIKSTGIMVQTHLQAEWDDMTFNLFLRWQDKIRWVLYVVTWWHDRRYKTSWYISPLSVAVLRQISFIVVLLFQLCCSCGRNLYFPWSCLLTWRSISGLQCSTGMSFGIGSASKLRSPLKAKRSKSAGEWSSDSALFQPFKLLSFLLSVFSSAAPVSHDLHSGGRVDLCQLLGVHASPVCHSDRTARLAMWKNQ